MARRSVETVKAAARRREEPLRWVKAPKQPRSQATLDRLLDATERIVREQGVEAVTIPAVCKAARSSVGSFYARFPDKTALLHVLHDRACRQSIATAEAALAPERWKGVGTAALVEACVRFLVATFADRKHLMLGFGAALGGDATFAARRADTAVALARLVRRVVLARGEIRHPDPPRAVDLALRVVTATLEQRNGFEQSGVREVAISDEVLTEELIRLLHAYLGLA